MHTIVVFTRRSRHDGVFGAWRVAAGRGEEVLAAGCTADDLRHAVIGKELARGVLIGTFERWTGRAHSAGAGESAPSGTRRSSPKATRVARRDHPAGDESGAPPSGSCCCWRSPCPAGGPLGAVDRADLPPGRHARRRRVPRPEHRHPGRAAGEHARRPLTPA